MTNKICTRCEEPFELNAENFYRKAASSDGFSNRCKSCDSIVHKEYYKRTTVHERRKVSGKKAKLKKNYKISMEDYNRMYEHQQGKCAICSTTEKLVVDHDHETGKVRGLICQVCNHGLGRFRDDVQLLNNAIMYLKGEIDLWIPTQESFSRLEQESTEKLGNLQV